MTDLTTLLQRSRAVAAKANDESWLHIYEVPPNLRDADREHIAEASPERWLALLDVAQAAEDDYADVAAHEQSEIQRESGIDSCHVCGEDWPCRGKRLEDALDRLATVMEGGS